MIVLAVDDSDLNLAIYRSILTKIENVEVAAFTSPSDALAWAEDQSVALAVVDYHMPELDGIGFMSRFRALRGAEHALAVMVTSDSEPEVRRAALTAGVNDFLTKPIDRFEFTARMRNMLEVASSRRALADRAEWLRSEVMRATEEIFEREVETIARLTRTAEFRDDITGMHVVRVGHMCAALARSIGLDEDECRQYLLAAPMHDIGKVSTPDAILLKPGRLDADEMEIMRHHTTAGFEILKNSKSPMLQLAAEIALTHHERYDGKGYPRGLSAAQIPLGGRLCSIVDVFDALTSERPYKKAWTIEDAFANIRENAGTQFDPEIFATFERSFDDMLEIKRRFSDGRIGESAYAEWWRV